MSQITSSHAVECEREAVGLKVLTVAPSMDFLAAVNGLLSAEGYQAFGVLTGAEALAIVGPDSHAIVLVDGSLTDMGVGELCARLRACSSATIVAFTGPSREDQKLLALAAGADAFLPKPFSGVELVELLRGSATSLDRNQMINPQNLGHISIDRVSRQVHCNGLKVHLTRIEFDLLSTLASQPDMVFSRKELLERVWPDFFGDDQVLSVHMANLRRKIDGDRSSISTVRGVGYRMSSFEASVA